MRRRQTAEEAAFLQTVGRKLRELRTARGWTLAQVAARAGFELQNYAVYEKGRNLNLLSLHRVTRALDVAPGEVFGKLRDDALESLRRRGWRVWNVDKPGRLPAFDLRAAAGRDVHHGAVETLGWLTPPKQKFAAVEGLFLARAAGSSMAPLVVDGAWCVFRQPVVPPLVGKILLLQTQLPGDPEGGGGYRLKRVGAIEAVEYDGRVRVRLDSLDRSVEPWWVDVDSEADLAAQGEFVDVVAEP